MKPQTNPSEAMTFDQALKLTIELGKKEGIAIPIKPRKPTAEEIKYKKALDRAMKLDTLIDPTIEQITNHLRDMLEDKNEMELLAVYAILITGSALSMYAPRHLAAGEMSDMGFMDIVISSARKAERLLRTAATKKATKTPAARRTAQRRAAQS